MRFFIAILVLGVSACTEKKVSRAEHSDSHKIQWHEGNIAALFERAKKDNKPMFVYWGANWCPPCNVVKATLFTNPRVIQATHSYLNIYLDGDSDEAQLWGEKLNALGYPTIMVLNPSGEEISRLAYNVSPDQFAQTLTTTYHNLHPIEDTVQALLKDQTSDRQKWQLVTNYSWGQRESKKINEESVATVFGKLENKIPGTFAEEKARMFLLYLIGVIVEKLDFDKKMAEQRVGDILDSSKLSEFNRDLLCFYSKKVIEGLNQPKVEQTQFINKWKKSAENLRKKGTGSKYDELITYYPALELKEFVELSKAEKDQIQRDVPKYISESDDHFTNTFSINSASYILEKAGFVDLAKKHLLASLATTKAPYYFMSGLASLEKTQGNKKEALRWSKAAYDSSEGTNTRLEWAISYIKYLLELDPTAKQKILEVVENFHKTHVGEPDAFVGRNKKKLEVLAEKLKEWAKHQKKEKVLAAKALGHRSNCKKDESNNYSKACESYFSSLM